MNDKIRVGLLIDSFRLPAWIVEMIKKIAAIDDVEIVALITPVNFQKPNNHYPSLWSYYFYTRVDRLLYSSSPDPNVLTDLLPAVKHIPEIKVTPIASLEKIEINTADINAKAPSIPAPRGF